MFIQAYQLDEVHFACCFRVYYRWHTHRASIQRALVRLDRGTFDSLTKDYGVHILEVSASQTEVKVLASMLPPRPYRPRPAR